jgi:carbamate kinase
MKRSVVGILMQVVVDQQDAAFQHPTKPIGPFYAADDARRLSEAGFPFVEDAGRGYRRVVPSPAPHELMDVDVVRSLLDLGVVVITAGGGGIPVVWKEGRLEGIEAVIDKDATSALLADIVDASNLIILTNVPCAFRNFRTTNQKPIGSISVSEARCLIGEGHFAEGSMRPKIEAAVRFCTRNDRTSIICNFENLTEALRGDAGTIVSLDG